jgi:hypothetical protein
VAKSIDSAFRGKTNVERQQKEGANYTKAYGL